MTVGPQCTYRDIRDTPTRATARHVTQPNPSTIERELPFLMKRPATNLGLTVANLSFF